MVAVIDHGHYFLPFCTFKLTCQPSGEHSRRYNRPLSDEIGVLMPNDATNNRDIVLHYRDGGLKHISELDRSYDSLQYPLLFPHGTEGLLVSL